MMRWWLRRRLLVVLVVLLLALLALAGLGAGRGRLPFAAGQATALVAAPEQRVYAGNGGSDTLSVISTTTNTVIATIPVGAYPVGVTASPDGRRVYTGNNVDASVSVVDTATAAVVRTIALPAGAGPFGVAVSPDSRRLYVANHGPVASGTGAAPPPFSRPDAEQSALQFGPAQHNAVTAIDTVTNTIITHIAVGNRPHSVVVTPDGLRVYVTNTTDRTVSVIDTATNTAVATIAVQADPYGIAVSPNGARVYVANDADSSVSVINTATNAVVATVTVGEAPYGVVVNPAGTRAYVTNAVSHTISVIDTATNTVVATASIAGTEPYGVSITEDGSRVYSTLCEDNKISVIDTATNTVITTIPVGMGPQDVVVAPRIAPALTSLSPSSAAAGGPAFTLTVNGSNFVSSAAVQWNGAARTTTFVSASVTIADPLGTVTAARTFTITGGAVACNAVSLSPNPASPRPVGTAVTFTAVASPCSPAVYQFWVQTPAASWTIAQAYSSSGTFNWNTASLSAGVYQIAVWAKQSGSAATLEWSNQVSYTLTSTTAPCTAVSLTVAPPSPQSVGTAVTAMALAGGCSTPLYQFWLLPPGGAWTVAQPYSASATFNWTTSGLVSGTYQVAVWVKQTGSVANFEWSNQQSYMLSGGGTSCTAVSESATPASPKARGTSIHVSALAGGCPAPLYQFWLQGPGLAWTAVQAYSAPAAWDWSTGSYPAGTYQVAVWVKRPARPRRSNGVIRLALRFSNGGIRHEEAACWRNAAGFWSVTDIGRNNAGGGGPVPAKPT